MEAEDLMQCSLPCLCDLRPPEPPPWMNESVVQQTQTKCDGWKSYQESCMNIQHGLSTELIHQSPDLQPGTMQNQTNLFAFKENVKLATAGDNGLWGIGVFFGVVLLVVLIAAAIFIYKKKKRPSLDLSMYDRYNYLHHKAKRKETWQHSTDTLPTDLSCDGPVNDSTVEISDNNKSSDDLNHQNNNSSIPNGLPPIKTLFKSSNKLNGSFKNRVGVVDPSPAKSSPSSKSIGKTLPPLKITSHGNKDIQIGRRDVSDTAPPMAFNNSAYDAAMDSGYDDLHPGKL